MVLKLNWKLIINAQVLFIVANYKFKRYFVMHYITYFKEILQKSLKTCSSFDRVKSIHYKMFIAMFFPTLFLKPANNLGKFINFYKVLCIDFLCTHKRRKEQLSSKIWQRAAHSYNLYRCTN